VDTGQRRLIATCRAPVGPAALVSLVALVALAGCAGSAPGGGAASPSAKVPASASAPSGPTASPVTATPSAVPSEPSTAALPDGRHFGYIKDVDPTSLTMMFDLAYFLTGTEADKAAQAHGALGPGQEHIENDYFIVNDNPMLRTLSIAAGAKVHRIGPSGPDATKDETLSELAGNLNLHDELGFWVKVQGGKVVDIEEQFQP
jgi:hypothetical protein